MNQAVLVLSDKYSAPILTHFEQIHQATRETFDTFFLFHQKESNLPLTVKNIPHFVFSDTILEELGYQAIDTKLVPGSNHFPLLKFYLQNPHYDYYWNIEDDVRFRGDWAYFFACFSNVDYDFMACHVETYLQHQDWFWWNTLKYKEQAVLQKHLIKSFNPIYRISNRALKLLHTSLLDAWKGHHEVLIPTLLNMNDYSVGDFGGRGSFVPLDFRNKFYTLETMQHRPIYYGRKINKLYHPIKVSARL